MAVLGSGMICGLPIDDLETTFAINACISSAMIHSDAPKICHILFRFHGSTGGPPDARNRFQEKSFSMR